ncbi:MAG: Co2+/Mg2+ efflux protein ApaG [Rickettsiaceae bacterium H1]|nr:Co2+/Mg2+ efflux protein ApaG [Rickettsiaceae bacterium H1]
MSAKNYDYSAITESIVVTVTVSYLGEQNIVNDEGCYIWAYNVNIFNKGQYTVKLLNRYWKIIDGRGAIDEVKGVGVVGEQPTLAANETFEYASGAYLSTISGLMEGYYEFLNEDLKKIFKVIIPIFSLDSPYCYIRPN